MQSGTEIHPNENHFCYFKKLQMPYRTTMYEICSMISLLSKTKMSNRTLNYAETICFSEFFEQVLPHNSKFKISYLTFS